MNMIFSELAATKEKLGFSANCDFQLIRGGQTLLSCALWNSLGNVQTAQMQRLTDFHMEGMKR